MSEFNTPIVPDEQTVPQQSTPNVVYHVTVNNGLQESFFDGKLIQQIGYLLLGLLITVCTLGICWPFAHCLMYRWKIKHTVINGHRLAFDGRGIQLWGKWLLWALLCIITFGIYSFWLHIALERWRAKHTHFAN